MISIEEAQGTILARISQLEVEKVAILQGLNRVTPEDHIAPWDIPPADNSAMDGFAFSGTVSNSTRLRVNGFIPAGDNPQAAVPEGEAVRIMTGAPIPPGCDTVVPFEDVTDEGEWILLPQDVRTGSHIRRRGEDIRCGDAVIKTGTILRPQEIGMLTAMGITTVSVYRRARVAILATGDELLEPGCTPAPGKIINSNSYSVAAQVLDAGGEPLILGIARDTMEATCEKIKSGLNADILVTTGGVSVGDRDLVKKAIEEVGGSIVFWKVNMKPGKPLAFAIVQGKPFFALPGNPVSAMVSFELFVRPSLLKAMGHQRLHRPIFKMTLMESLVNKGKRPHMVRGVVSRSGDNYHISTTGNQSSGRLSSLTQGNGLICLGPESSYSAGDTVEVMLLGKSYEM